MSFHSVKETQLIALEAATELVSLLPRADLVIELDELLMKVWAITSSLVEGEMIDDDDLFDLKIESAKINESVRNLKQLSKKNV